MLLLDQNRGRWDWAQIGRGLAALERAESLTDARGPYAVQAAIAACHARARTAEATDWVRIASLYGDLATLTAHPWWSSTARLPCRWQRGRRQPGVLEPLVDEPSLRGYHLLPSARGDLLERLGRVGEARAEFERAAGMTRNERERGVLLARAAGLAIEP